MHQDERVRVLYIMGTARSGSTILEILLANGKAVFGAGELTALVHDGLIGDKNCSCGVAFHRCAIWEKVQGKLGLDPESYKEWNRLQGKIDWHDGFFRQIFGLMRRRDWKYYQEYNLKLLNAIKQATGAAVIIDSSKYAGRALALNRMQEIDLQIICLTRAPAALMASFQKPNREEQRPKKPLAVLLYYCITLISLRLAAIRMMPRVFFLSYEEFVHDPVHALNDIAAWAGLDLTRVCASLIDNGDFNVGHIVTGNRVRKQGMVKFHTTADKGETETPVQQLIVELMNLWKKLAGF